MSEDIDRYERTAAAFDQRVRAVPAGKWDAQSPCEKWVARDVVGHVVGNHRYMTAQAMGGEPKEMSADEDPVQAWAEAYDGMHAVAKDRDALAKEVNGPTGPVPLEQAMGSFMSMDMHVHTWDLARAVGGDERLDPEMSIFAMNMLSPVDEMIRQPNVFGPKLDPPAGADDQTKMLYFLGRKA